MATYLFSAVYEHGKASHGLSHTDDCRASDCFSLTYIVCAICCLAGAACTLDLARRTRHRYRVLSVAYR